MASAAPVEQIDPGRVISRGFAALKANFLPFFAAGLLLAGGPTFLFEYFAMGAGVSDPAIFVTAAFWGPMIGSFVAMAIGSALLQAMLVRSTTLHLSGREADVPGSAMGAIALTLPIIGVAICVSIVAGLGLLLLIIPGIMIFCALSVAVPALVEERCGVFASMSRSRDLTRGSRGQVFVVLLFNWVVSVVVNGVIGAVVGVGMFPEPGTSLPDPLFASTLYALGAGLIAVVSAVTLAALYLELRQVKEGAGAELLADVFA